MNTPQQPHITSGNTPQILPAYLWIGKHEELILQTEAWLQTQLCPKSSCNSCATCHAIRQQQCHAITWLHPDKQYTLDQLAIINSTLAFALDVGQKHFFVLQRADCLTPTCSNSLLKSLEEPPTGYHFILLAPQLNDILPTVRSRCVVQFFSAGKESIRHQNLYDIFTASTVTHPLVFLKALEQAHITEHESVELLDQLLLFWLAHYKKALIQKNQTQYQRGLAVINVLQQALAKPPMPGSSNLLWKDLYLHFN